MVTLRALVLLAAFVGGGLLSPSRVEGATMSIARVAEPERWAGEIATPGGKLQFVLYVTRDGANVTAKMAIPEQGIKDPVDLKDVKLEGTTLKGTFGIPPMAEADYAKFTLVFDDAAGTSSGTMEQSGAKFPVAMKRLAPGEELKGPNRPQNPKPPLPYTQREVVVTSADGAKLPGTLTLPAEKEFGKGPRPAVMLITGSGPQDRDESIMGHKPFLVLADALTRRGIVVLRVDDRGWASNANPAGENATTDTFVDDALACVEFLKRQPEADAARIGLVGHSEGGLVAPLAAVKSTDIAFIVLLAGTGVPGRQVLDAQFEAIVKAEGKEIDPATVAARKKALDLALDEAKAAEFDEALKDLVTLQLRAARRGAEPEPELVQQAVIQGKNQLASKWMRRFMVLDPREALRSTRVPVLALNGSLDMQVLATQNIPVIAAALMEAGNTDVTIRVLPGLNHLFQHATTGGVTEYEKIEETMSPEVWEIVSRWILERATAPASPRP